MSDTETPPFRRAVVALNGGPSDERIVRLLAQNARLTKAEIIAVHVVEIDWTLPLDADIAGRSEEVQRVLDTAETIAEERKMVLEPVLLQARDVAAGREQLDKRSVGRRDQQIGRPVGPITGALGVEELPQSGLRPFGVFFQRRVDEPAAGVLIFHVVGRANVGLVGQKHDDGRPCTFSGLGQHLRRDLARGVLQRESIHGTRRGPGSLGLAQRRERQDRQEQQTKRDEARADSAFYVTHPE